MKTALKFLLFILFLVLVKNVLGASEPINKTGIGCNDTLYFWDGTIKVVDAVGETKKQVKYKECNDPVKIHGKHKSKIKKLVLSDGRIKTYEEFRDKETMFFGDNGDNESTKDPDDDLSSSDQTPNNSNNDNKKPKSKLDKRAQGVIALILVSTFTGLVIAVMV